MAISKEIIICVCCLGALGLGWAGRSGLERMNLAQAQRESEVQKIALLKGRDQALAEIKVLKEKQAADDRIAAAGTSPAPAGGGAAAGKPAAPAATPEDAELKEFVAHARLSSILLGTPKIVVINKKEYEEGGEVPLPSGHRAKISEIREDGVTLTRDGRSYQLLASR